MKIDVEGHEAAAFRGAQSLLGNGAIDHVILEEHRDPPTEATSLLSGFGYMRFSSRARCSDRVWGDAGRRRGGPGRRRAS